MFYKDQISGGTKSQSTLSSNFFALPIKSPYVFDPDISPLVVQIVRELDIPGKRIELILNNFHMQIANGLVKYIKYSTRANLKSIHEQL